MNLVGSLCLLLLIAGEASSLSCNHCNDGSDWDSCQKKVQIGQCNLILTSDLHRNLQSLNPTLPVIPQPGIERPQYQCYELAIQFKIVQGSSSRMYELGCTYYEANFCEGWDMTILQQVNCSTNYIGVTDIDDDTDDSRGGSERMKGSLCGWLTVVFSALLIAFDSLN